jgi:hypothetical protein
MPEYLWVPAGKCREVPAYTGKCRNIHESTRESSWGFLYLLAKAWIYLSVPKGKCRVVPAYTGKYRNIHQSLRTHTRIFHQTKIL